MKTDEIRRQFLAFFEKRNHKVVPSDGLIPRDDPTLLFSGAGMNQFKDYFLGLKQDMTRATSVQKCLRTGDLDNVGRTPYHHSFFEMLGNFSFGDYFKLEAISWAWEFLTKELDIAPNRLRVSVYRDDIEAFDIWHKEIGIKSEEIARLDARSNFWPAGVVENGPNGPCGPCSEIYFDQGETVGCGKPSCSVECDCGRFAEIWNLVFTQFDRQSDGTLVPLKAKNIDTGMGLERLACVLQGKRFNYEIDLFEPILESIRARIPVPEESHRSDTYAIADHLRAVLFSVGDGAYPSNEGRGYVVRKLIRRAMWRARKIGIKLPVLSELVGVVVEVMRPAYPELVESEPYVKEVLRNEEERFLRTLEKGLNLIADRKAFSSEDVFSLYDTYGFPVELTKQIAEERGLAIDLGTFDELMDAQRERAKSASKISASIFSVDALKEELLRRKITPTVFNGYDMLELSDAKVEMLVNEEGISCKELSLDQTGLMVVNETPFYAESGGQVGDQGEYRQKEGSGFGDVLDTFKKEDFFFHRIKVTQGTLRIGEHVTLNVNAERRRYTMYNHTATHLLHAALRKLLGSHVRQLGSLVEARRLRFDFSHFKALTREELAEVEKTVNDEIAKAVLLDASVKSLDEAKKEGAIAFFGDKYGDRVRIITVGDFSKEFCGGTHVKNTSEIGRFKIISERSAGSGVRRIEAVTSVAVDEYLAEERKQREESARLNEAREEVRLKEEKSADRLLQEIDQKALIASAREIGGLRFVTHYVPRLDKKRLGTLADALKARLDQGLVAVFSESDGKLHMIVTRTEQTAAANVDAGELVRKISATVAGRGGGRKDFAQGGGEVPSDREAFMKQTLRIIEQSLKQ